MRILREIAGVPSRERPDVMESFEPGRRRGHAPWRHLKGSRRSRNGLPGGGCSRHADRGSDGSCSGPSGGRSACRSCANAPAQVPWCPLLLAVHHESVEDVHTEREDPERPPRIGAADR
jgi:hypothetical protein